jgi:fibronectin-binding autotransporter adhesin
MQVDYVRGKLSGNWSAFTGIVNATARSSPSEFRIANGTMFQKATVILNNNVLMDRNGGSSTIDIGALGGTSGAIVGKGSSSSSGTTYRIGWNNSDATFAGSFENDGTTTVTKEGTGIWTLTGANSWSGGLTINGGLVRANNASGSGTGSGSVVVNNGGALGGSGAVSGSVTVNPGGAIDPGASVGTLNLNNTLTLGAGAVSRFELGSVNASDRVAVSGSLNLGGSLYVTNLPGFGAGDYTLFTYGGSRSGTLAIGAMPAGYSGSINTTVAGQVRLIVTVTAEPVINGVSRNANSIEFSGTGGTADGTYYLLSSTNIALPLGNWLYVLTNQFDGNGDFYVTNSVDPTTPELFYRLQLP